MVFGMVLEIIPDLISELIHGRRDPAAEPTKKVEHSPRLQNKITSMAQAAGENVDDIKGKVGHEKMPADTDMDAVMKLIKTLPVEQQEAAMAIIAQAQAQG